MNKQTLNTLVASLSAIPFNPEAKCPVTGKLPVGGKDSPAPMEGAPGSFYFKSSNGEIGYYDLATGKRRGASGGATGPRKDSYVSIPASVFLTVPPVLPVLTAKSSEAEKQTVREISSRSIWHNLGGLSIQYGGSPERIEEVEMTDDEMNEVDKAIEKAAKKAGMPITKYLRNNPANYTKEVTVKAIAAETLTLKALAAKNKEGTIELSGSDFRAILSQFEAGLRDAGRILTGTVTAKAE